MLEIMRQKPRNYLVFQTALMDIKVRFFNCMYCVCVWQLRLMQGGMCVLICKPSILVGTCGPMSGDCLITLIES